MGVYVMLEIKNLSKTYKTKKALIDVSFTVNQGEIIGLFGENGAGKTTLLKSVLGLIPSQGEVTIDGEKVSRKNIHRLSFATCEHSFFPNITAKAHADFYNEHFPKFSYKRFKGLMEFFSLPMHRDISSFSAGQKNQFEVIMSLSQGADYILMDEPFVGNDIFNREDFYKVLLGILEENETIILSTHLIDEVENFISRAVLLRNGRLVGDVSISDIEDSGKTLVEAIKEKYDYRADRVSKAINELTGGESV